MKRTIPVAGEIIIEDSRLSGFLLRFDQLKTSEQEKDLLLALIRGEIPGLELWGRKSLPSVGRSLEFWLGAPKFTPQDPEKDGFYKIKINGSWKIGEFSNGMWWFCGGDMGIDSKDLDLIGDRIDLEGE